MRTSRAKLLYLKICESEWCHVILCDPGTSILVIVASFDVFSFCETKRSLMSCRLRRCLVFFFVSAANFGESFLRVPVLTFVFNYSMFIPA